jgi:alpha-galactosidase
MDLFDVYRESVEKYRKTGFGGVVQNWANKCFVCNEKVKFDLFRRYGWIAAAGDRHLAEFCEGKWYLESPEKVKEWGFGLTPVSFRKEDLKKRLARSERLRSGEEAVALKETGEDGVKQIRALLGLEDLVTNVNLPNVGQIEGLPLGAVVETNAVFTSNSVTPVIAGKLPMGIYPLISRAVAEQELVLKACHERDLELAFTAFINDPLVTINKSDARALFDEMVENTKEYLTEYFK